MSSEARSMLGALTGAVKKIAGTTVRALDTADSSIGMLDNMVQDAAKRQQLRSAVDMENYAATYKDQAAMRRTEAQLQVLEFTRKSPEHAALYQDARSRIEDAVKRRMMERKNALVPAPEEHA